MSQARNKSVAAKKGKAMRPVLIKFTAEEWAQIEAERRRQEYETPISTILRTLIFRALNSDKTKASLGVPA